MSARIFIYACMSLFLFILAACATTDSTNSSTAVLDVPGCG